MTVIGDYSDFHLLIAIQSYNIIFKICLIYGNPILLQNILITVHKTTYDAHILKVNKIVHMSLHMMYTS